MWRRYEAGVVWSHHVRVDSPTPESGAAPIKRIAVVPEVPYFMLPCDGPFGINVGAVLHLLFGNRDGEHLVRPVRVAHRDRRDQYLSTRKPGSGVDHEIADNPCCIIEIKVFDMTDGAVGRADRVALQIIHAA